MNTRRGIERRRHVRVNGQWPITAHSVEHTGETRTFDATMLDISLSGILLEAVVTANLWLDKPLLLDLPGSVGQTPATVRRFLEYGDGGTTTSRWGIELTHLTLVQRALWGRFVFTTAHQSNHPLATSLVRLAAPAAAPSRSVIHNAIDARTT